MNKLNNICRAVNNTVAGLGLLLLGIFVTIGVLIEIWNSSKLLFLIVIGLIILQVWTEYLEISREDFKKEV